VQTVYSFFPELNDFGSDAVATPSIGAGWVPFVVKRSDQLSQPLFEYWTASDHHALVADDSTPTSPQRP